MARHGGGAFSGKDPTKVDRSAAYAVRQIAKAVVAAGLAKRCEAQVAYAIGVAHPVSIMVDTFGTSEIAPEKLEAMVREVFDMRPAAIIERLDLRRPIFKRTAAYGHFGRTEGDGFTWENTDALRRRAAPRGRLVADRIRVTALARTCLRVVPDVTAVDRAFDYSVPDALAALAARRHDRARAAARPAGARLGDRDAVDVDAGHGRRCSTCSRSCRPARPPTSSS